MAKRYTDNEKWRDEWWGSLSNDYRMIWLYLVDSCTNAGRWKKDFRGLNFNCNTNVTEESFLAVFKDRLIDCGNFYFIPKFLRFQNPKGLNSNKPAVLSVVKEITENNLIPIVHQSLGNDFLIIKGKGKGKGKGMEEEKEREEKSEEKNENPPLSEKWFDSILTEIQMETLSMTFRDKDIPEAIKTFKAKARAAPEQYQYRDAGGIMLAIHAHLRSQPGKRINGHSKRDISNL
ncbi:MAG: hypothetical protein WAZ98_03790 [Cyclobacteriaceae bacterium]